MPLPSKRIEISQDELDAETVELVMADFFRINIDSDGTAYIYFLGPSGIKHELEFDAEGHLVSLVRDEV